MKTSTTIALALATLLSAPLAAYAQTEQPTSPITTITSIASKVRIFIITLSTASSRTTPPSPGPRAGSGLDDRSPSGTAVRLGFPAYRALPG